MIKTFVILDSQPGNARLMTVVADMLKKSAGEADSFLLLTN